jgi:hypothetical protein
VGDAFLSVVQMFYKAHFSWLTSELKYGFDKKTIATLLPLGKFSNPPAKAVE